MEGSGQKSNTKMLNPWMLQFQKMGLELKCPLCLNLFSRPILLPCNHIFCNSCLADCTRLESECALCKTQFVHRDLRHVSFVENMANIYRSLDATFSASIFQQFSSDGARALEPCQASLTSSFDRKLTREPLQTSEGNNLRVGESVFSSRTTKPVDVPLGLLHSNEVAIGNNQNNQESGIAMCGKAEGPEMLCTGRVHFSGRGKINWMQGSQLGFGGQEECGVAEMDMNQVTQSLPGSPPFCDSKGSDNDSNDHDNQHLLLAERQEGSSLKRASKANGNLEDRMTQLRSESSDSQTEDITRELKRQKNLIHGEAGFNNQDQIQPTVTYKPVGSSCDRELKSEMFQDALLPAIPDKSHSNTSICSFCQSSKITEVTGPMLHYANGNSVEGDAATEPNVMHVHGLCIEWAPQVYFVDDTVKNLKQEVARGSKLKCGICGLRGAALGCYVKSCKRTYHAPCAMEISTARWDHENFLMLCPSHSQFAFPQEKPRNKKKPGGPGHKQPMSSPLPKCTVSQQSNLLATSVNDDKKWVFCGSSLSSKEKILLINFASKTGATVTKFWTPNVTHVIAAIDENGACSRTLKVLMAILNGRWVLKMDWIKASMEALHPVEEEAYEINLDKHGCLSGPKVGRLRALTNEPKLLTGLSFYFSGDYIPAYKEDIEDLVVAGGGSVLRSKEELVAKAHGCEMTASKLLVVYNIDPPQGCRLGDEVSIIWHRLNEAEDLAASTGAQVIGHTWLLESIAACKLQPLAAKNAVSGLVQPCIDGKRQSAKFGN